MTGVNTTLSQVVRRNARDLLIPAAWGSRGNGREACFWRSLNGRQQK